MAIINKYPYTDFENLNLDWIISKVKEYLAKVDTLEISFKDLKEYVTNYFDELDIQAEVNAKLDEMASDGTLAEIIAQYLQLQSLVVFNTKSAMKAGQNFVNDMSALTLGNSAYNDGYTALYKIRTITSSDVVDDVNIIALTDYPTLIAERLDQKTNRYFLIIGDSYANRNPSWVDYFKQHMKLSNNETYEIRVSGSGFTRTVTDYGTWQDMMENASITDKSKVTDIIVCGGANDRVNTFNTVRTAVSDFCTSAKTLYPNAVIRIGFIAWCTDPTEYDSLETTRRAYSYCNESGAIYLTGCEYALHRGTNVFADRFHPNTNGEQYIGKAIFQAYIGGVFEDKTMWRGVVPTGIDETVITGNNILGNTDVYVDGDEVVLDIKSRCYIDGSFSRNTWYQIGYLSDPDHFTTPIFGSLINVNNIDMICYAQRESDSGYEFIKCEFQIYRGTDFDTDLKTYWRFRFLQATASTIKRIYFGGCKFRLNAMTQC